MSEKTFKTRLRILYLYAGINSSDDFEDQLTVFSLNRNIGSENTIKRKIHRWIVGESTPQAKNLDLIGEFFSRKLMEEGKLFIPEWLTMDLSELFVQDELQDIINDENLETTASTAIVKPYSVLKSYRAYSKLYPKFLRHLWKSISGYYTLQRYHSDGTYIQELLHIHGFEEGSVLSTVYEYSTYGNGIRIFHGNGFIHKESVVFIFCSEKQDAFYSPEFDVYIIPHDENNPDTCLGVGIGLADTTHDPTAYAFVMTRLEKNQVVDIKKYVRAINEEEQKKDIKIMRNIEALNLCKTATNVNL